MLITLSIIGVKTYNKRDFFDIFKKQSFIPIWESKIYDGNCKSYLLKKL